MAQIVVDGIKFLSVGTDPYEVLIAANDYSGDIVIPANFVCNGKGYHVVGLRPSCFENCTNLTSVTIPEGVSYLGNCCFGNCI